MTSPTPSTSTFASPGKHSGSSVDSGVADGYDVGELPG